MAKILLTMAILIGLSSFFTKHGDSEGELSLKISLESDTIVWGRYPEIAATITNGTSDQVLLVQPGDGSESGWRSPLVGWSAIDVQDAAAMHPSEVPVYQGPRCGMMNPLTEQELVSLDSGESMDLLSWARFPYLEPGTYRLRLYYTNDPDMIWVGGHDLELLELVRQSTACELVSNEIEITIGEENLSASD